MISAESIAKVRSTVDELMKLEEISCGAIAYHLNEVGEYAAAEALLRQSGKWQYDIGTDSWKPIPLVTNPRNVRVLFLDEHYAQKVYVRGELPDPNSIDADAVVDFDGELYWKVKLPWGSGWSQVRDIRGRTFIFSSAEKP